MTIITICDKCGKQAKQGETKGWEVVVFDDPTCPWPLRKFKDLCPECKEAKE